MQKNIPATNETYKMKTKNLLIGVIILISLQSFSQTDKKVFVYKTVQRHEIKANIFLPKNNELHPVVVFFHGGFFWGNRDQGLNISLKNKLIESGYAVVSADFRLCPETKLKGLVEDATDICVWLRKNGLKEFNIDIDKIAVLGCSAGGYLALTTGFSPQNVKVIISISAATGFSVKVPTVGDLSGFSQLGQYGVISDSIVSYGDYDNRMALSQFLVQKGLMFYALFGFDPSTEPEKLAEFSLSNNIKSDYPPTFLIHAKTDHLVDLQQVNDFHNFLTDKQIKTELCIVENGHSNELINQNPEVLDKIVAFLNITFKR
jgi:acetyl esterase/lipase